MVPWVRTLFSPVGGECVWFRWCEPLFFSLPLVWSVCGSVGVNPFSFSPVGVECCWPRWRGAVLFCHFAYSLSEILNNPPRDYPSSMSPFGMETDGALLNPPIFSASWGGGKGQKPGLFGDQAPGWGDNDPATCGLEAIAARRAPGASFTFLYLEGCLDSSRSNSSLFGQQ